MKQIILSGLITLTALSSCEWIRTDDPLTHEEIIHQQMRDTLAYLAAEEDLFSVMFINLDGSFQNHFADYTMRDDGFATELEVYPSDDTLAIEYQFFSDFVHESTRHYPIPYSVIDSV